MQRGPFNEVHACKKTIAILKVDMCMHGTAHPGTDVQPMHALPQYAFLPTHRAPTAPAPTSAHAPVQHRAAFGMGMQRSQAGRYVCARCRWSTVGHPRLYKIPMTHGMPETSGASTGLARFYRMDR